MPSLKTAKSLFYEFISTGTFLVFGNLKVKNFKTNNLEGVPKYLT